MKGPRLGVRVWDGGARAWCAGHTWAPGRASSADAFFSRAEVAHNNACSLARTSRLDVAATTDSTCRQHAGAWGRRGGGGGEGERKDMRRAQWRSLAPHSQPSDNVECRRGQTGGARKKRGGQGVAVATVRHDTGGRCCPCHDLNGYGSRPEAARLRARGWWALASNAHGVGGHWRPMPTSPKRRGGQI